MRPRNGAIGISAYALAKGGTSRQSAAVSNRRRGQYPACCTTPFYIHEESPWPSTRPYPPAPAPADPGRTLGIVGLILAFFCSLIGLIISIIAYRQSQQAGYKNNIALAGIIVGAVSLVFGLILQFTGALAGLFGQ